MSGFVKKTMELVEENTTADTQNISMDVDSSFLTIVNDILARPSGFAAQGHLEGSEMPPITVEGIDTDVRVPVSPEQARALYECGEQAPFGQGEKTIIDRSVRDVKAIASDKCSFPEKWSTILNDNILDSLRRQLGIQSSVRAELHNLLVYAAGGKFKRHKDSEKLPGMFGSLVVTLPSTHSGGRFLIHHGDETVSFLAAGNNSLGAKLEEASPKRRRRLLQTTPRWCGFYADCDHELEEVTNGYRVALVYNLVREDSGAESPKPHSALGSTEYVDAFRQFGAGWSVALEEESRLQRTYTEEQQVEVLETGSLLGSNIWRRGTVFNVKEEAIYVSLAEMQDKIGSEKVTSATEIRPMPNKILFTLSHEYTEDGMAWDKLKGTDYAIGHALRKSTQFEMFLCQMTLEQSGDEHEGMDTAGVTLNGWVPAPMAADEWHHPSLARTLRKHPHYIHFANDVRGNDFCIHEDPYDTEKEGYTGNQGSPMSQWYKKTAIVFWPKQQVMDVVSIGAQIEMLAHVLNGTDALMTSLFNNVQAMAELVLNNLKEHPSPTAIGMSTKSAVSILSCCLQFLNKSNHVLSDFISALSFDDRQESKSSQQNIADCASLVVQAVRKNGGDGTIAKLFQKLFLQNSGADVPEQRVAFGWRLLFNMWKLNEYHDESVVSFLSNITDLMLADLAQQHCERKEKETPRNLFTQKSKTTRDVHKTNTLGWCLVTLSTIADPERATICATQALKHIAANSRRFEVLSTLPFVLGQMIRSVTPDFQEKVLHPLIEIALDALTNPGPLLTADDITCLLYLIHDCNVPGALQIMLENKERVLPWTFVTGVRNMFLEKPKYSWNKTDLQRLREASPWIGDCLRSHEEVPKKTADSAEEPFQYPQVVSTRVWPETVLQAVSMVPNEMILLPIAKTDSAKQRCIVDAFVAITHMLPRVSFQDTPYINQLTHCVVRMQAVFPLFDVVIPATQTLFKLFGENPQSLASQAILFLVEDEIERIQPFAEAELPPVTNWTMTHPRHGLKEEKRCSRTNGPGVCELCTKVTAFFESPTEKVFRLSDAMESEREHVLNSVNWSRWAGKKQPDHYECIETSGELICIVLKGAAASCVSCDKVGINVVQSWKKGSLVVEKAGDGELLRKKHREIRKTVIAMREKLQATAPSQRKADDIPLQFQGTQCLHCQLVFCNDCSNTSTHSLVCDECSIPLCRSCAIEEHDHLTAGCDECGEGDIVCGDCRYETYPDEGCCLNCYNGWSN